MGGARVALLVLAGFVALTAIGGGIALAAGLEGERFPREWLEGSPFEDYRAPGLILAGAVGGSAGLAAVGLLVAGNIGAAVSIVAGVVLAGYVGAEIWMLKQPSAPTATEVLYLAVATAMVVLGVVVL
jgi:hypothetical protein